MIAITTLVAGLLVTLGCVAWSSRGIDGSTRVALVVCLGTSAAAFNIVVPVPNVEATTTAVLCAAIALGMRTGAAVGLVAIVGTSVTGGVGSWTIWQIVGMCLVAGIGDACVPQHAHRLTLAAAACCATLAYDVVVTVPTALMLGPPPGATVADQVTASLLLGTPFTLVHVAATTAMTTALGPSLLFALARARGRLRATVEASPG